MRGEFPTHSFLNLFLAEILPHHADGYESGGGRTGYRPLPHHRTCGFPHTAVEHSSFTEPRSLMEPRDHNFVVVDYLALHE